MLKLVLYQMLNTGRWRWKLMYGKRCVARADYHWATKSAARLAFNSMAKNVIKSEGVISDA